MHVFSWRPKLLTELVNTQYAEYEHMQKITTNCILFEKISFIQSEAVLVSDLREVI